MLVNKSLIFPDTSALGALRERFLAAQPFPHIVIDGVLPPLLLAAAQRGFPGPDAPMWHRFRSGTQNGKLQSVAFDGAGPAVRRLLALANAPASLRWLEGATGIDGLIADPAYEGGGLHQTLPGGHLSVHVDYNYHPSRAWHRRLNAILFLNERWDERWGGHLELWDAGNRRAVQRIAPVANRLVVFATGEHSWHGHPEPLACPADVTRRSIAAYYYTHARPEAEIAPAHNTRFRPRPGERFNRTARERLGVLARGLGLR